MAHFRISDDIEDHPQFMDLSDRAFRVWVYAEAWCQRHLTDGLIPARMAVELRRSSTKIVSEIVASGLFVVECESYRLVGFLKHNDSRDLVSKRRAQKKERIDRWRKRQAAPATAQETQPEPGYETGYSPPNSNPAPHFTSPHLSGSNEPRETPRPVPIHQRSRPNRMNPGGVVPLIDTQFGEFVSRVTPEYSDRSAGYAAVLAWMNREDDAALSRGRSIPGDPFKWWQARFDAWKRDDAPPRPTVCRHRHEPPCANDAVCTRRYLDEQRGAPVAS